MKPKENWNPLTFDEAYVIEKKGTERPFTGEYYSSKEPGIYHCKRCDLPLYRSDSKFDSGCGWPSFYAPKEDDAVELISDFTMGMKRTEVRCAACGSHLGHVFEGEGYEVPTDQRWCINSVSLDLDLRD